MWSPSDRQCMLATRVAEAYGTQANTERVNAALARLRAVTTELVLEYVPNPGATHSDDLVQWVGSVFGDCEMLESAVRCVHRDLVGDPGQGTV